MAVGEKAIRYTQSARREADVFAAAEAILRRRLERLGALASPEQSAAFLRMRLAHLHHEEFHAVWLDNRHKVLAVDSLFRGTLDGASVHAREVVKAALRWNAAAVILVHFVARHKMRILCPVFLCAVLGGQERTSWASGQNRGT